MAVAYSMSSVTVKDGATKADFVVKRTGTKSELNEATSVDYETQDVGAKAGEDYTATSGSLDFAAGATEETVSVAILDKAYQSKTSLSFLLSLTGFGAAACRIVPSANKDTTQFYLYVPEDETLTSVPTANDPGDNLKHQAETKDLSDPTEGNTQLDKPLAYLRLGYGRADLNYYERIILDTDTYHPKWKNGDADPKEPGEMKDFMLPRAINRKKHKDVSGAEENNKHLDGILIYSDKNYNVTVGGQASTVVQGDFIQSVQGTGRLNWRNNKQERIYDAGSDTVHHAIGSSSWLGKLAVYDISCVPNLEVSVGPKMSYSFDDKFSVSNDTELSITNSAQYGIANGINMQIKGAQATLDCDIFGNFEATLPGGVGVKSYSLTAGMSATQRLCLSVAPMFGNAVNAPVAGAAIVNAAAAALLATGAAATTLALGNPWVRDEEPEALEIAINQVLGDGTVVLCQTLAAATGAIVVAAAALQAIQEAVALVASESPSITLTPAAITLACGPQSSIKITQAGITITAPELIENIVANKTSNVGGDKTSNVIGAEENTIGGAQTTEAAGEINTTASNVSIEGETEVTGNLMTTMTESGE